MLVCVLCLGCSQISVTPVNNSDIIALSANDTATILLRSGFSREEILDCGLEFRNSLAKTGAAQIRVKDFTEAIFAVQGKHVYCTSRRRGSFIYDTRTKSFL